MTKYTDIDVCVRNAIAGDFVSPRFKFIWVNNFKAYVTLYERIYNYDIKKIAIMHTA